MLNYEGAKKGLKNMVIDTWTSDEFDLIAAELKQRFPTKRYGNMYSLEFTANEVEEAAESVLPQHRHKSVSDYLDIRRPMFDAFTRLTKPGMKQPALSVIPGSFDSEGRIKWSIQEWEAVVLELHQLCPKAFDERLKNVHIGSVRLAMEVLEIPRRRQFKQIVSFKEQALRVWDDLPEEIKDPSKQDRPIIEFECGPVMAPPVTSKTKENPMAAALQKAFSEPPKPESKLKAVVITEKTRKKRVSWTDEQWLMIAREMHRQDPYGNLLTSSFPRLDLAAIRAAQRVIFSWENHKALKNADGLREPLLVAFATLKEEIASKNGGQVNSEKPPVSNEEQLSPAEITKQRRIQALMRANAARAKLTPEERRLATLKGHATRQANKAKLAGIPVPVAAPLVVEPVQVIEEKPVAIVENPVPVEEKSTFAGLSGKEMDFFGKVMNAAVPLMNVLIDEAVSRVVPGLIAGMLPQLEKSVGGIIHAAMASQMPQVVSFSRRQTETLAAPPVGVNQVFQDTPEDSKTATATPGPLSKAELAQYLPQPVEKPKKLKIAMLMSLGPQREQIRYSFPEYEFVFIDHGHGIKDAAKSCVLFIAVEKFINTNNKQQIKAYVAPEILKYVDGGVSAIKRQINVWKVQQAG